MSVSDIVDALESGLITENEAAEQAMVDTVDDLYRRRAAGGGAWASRSAARSARRAQHLTH